MRIYNGGLGKPKKEVSRLIKMIEDRIEEIQGTGKDGLLAQIKTAKNPQELAETYQLLFGEPYEFKTIQNKAELDSTIEEADVISETNTTELGKETDRVHDADITDDYPVDNSVSDNPTSKKVNSPFSAPVVDRSDYTAGETPQGQNAQPVDHIPEPTRPDFELPPEQPVGGKKVDQPKPFANPALKEMESDAKRKAAKIMAASIMTFFKKFQDKPFKWICKQGITEADLEKAAIAGELDIDEQLQIGEETILTVNQFFSNISARIDDSFVLDEATEKEIHDALIDVLIEQEIGMTPMQRLLTAIGGWAVQQIAQVVSFKREISGAMEVIKDNYKGKMEVEREKLELEREKNRLKKEELELEKERTKSQKNETAKAAKAQREKNEKSDKVSKTAIVKV